jgi:hypothetical protein
MKLLGGDDYLRCFSKEENILCENINDFVFFIIFAGCLEKWGIVYAYLSG